MFFFLFFIILKTNIFVLELLTCFTLVSWLKILKGYLPRLMFTFSFDFRVLNPRAECFLSDSYRHISPAFCIPAVNAKSSSWSDPLLPSSPPSIISFPAALCSSFLGDWHELSFIPSSVPRHPNPSDWWATAKKVGTCFAVCCARVPRTTQSPIHPKMEPVLVGKGGQNTTRNKSSRAELPSS